MKNRQLIMSLSLASAAVIGGNAPAQAVTFDFSYQPGITLEQMLGFEMAGQIWSYYLTDDVTVNIHVEMTNALPFNVLGGALPGIQKNKNYGTFRQNLRSDRTSADDYTAYEHLQAHLYQDGYTRYHSVFETGQRWYNKNISLTNANAKAINYYHNNNNNDNNDSLLDGYIVMNSDFNWSYDYERNEPIEEEEVIDFTSVAVHEIGHILGFVTGVDSTILADYDATDQQNLERLFRTTSLDMYRYSDWSAARNRLELAYGANAYFSLDGGDTALAYFSEGQDFDLGLGGDGYQASHWDGYGDDLGIMKPALGWGERANISALDLRAFDAIGWNLNPDRFPSQDSNELLDINNLDMTLDFNELLNNAKSTLGQKIGGNLNNCSVNPLSEPQDICVIPEELIDNVTQDRIDDVIEMYEWGHGGGGGGGGSGGSGGGGGSGGSGGGGSSGGGGNGSGQVLGHVLEQGFFSDFNWSTFNPDQGVAQVPDPGATSGLIGLGLFGIGGLFKGRRR